MRNKIIQDHKYEFHFIFDLHERRILELSFVLDVPLPLAAFFTFTTVCINMYMHVIDANAFIFEQPAS